MERMTKKFKNGNYYLENNFSADLPDYFDEQHGFNDTYCDGEPITKLGKLEDIEEELDIDLVLVLTKVVGALKALRKSNVPAHKLQFVHKGYAYELKKLPSKKSATELTHREIYILEQVEKGISFKDIAKENNTTCERVKQIYALGRRKIDFMNKTIMRGAEVPIATKGEYDK